MTKVTVDIKEVKKNPFQWANNVSIPVLEALLNKASQLYYNTDKTILSDQHYDTLIEVLETRKPDSKILEKVGAEIDLDTSKDKVKLPIHMGSMNKVKTRDGVVNWLKDYHDKMNINNSRYVISDKLDGASALLIYKNNEIKMYTRGNGTIGRDISKIAHNMHIPHYDDDIKEMVFRGELIVSKKNFEKYKDKYSNSRAMVNGIIGSKTMDINTLKVLDFVLFEVVEPELKPSAQFSLAKKLGFKLPHNEIVTFDEINSWSDNVPVSDTNRVLGSFILNTLIKYKTQSDYDIDGIIVTHDKIYERNTSKNPKYSFAFKANSEGVLTTVKRVIWNTSKHGYLIPTIEIEPVNLDIIIKHATAFNAKYIMDNNLGPGSKIRIARSGEVIPYITEIVESTKAQMPECEYKWNKTKVNILLVNPDESLNQKIVLNFFRTLGVENLSIGLIKKLILNKFDTIKKIIEMSVDNFLSMEGIKTTMANKLYNNIHKITDHPIEASTVMAASLKFGHGFGRRRFDAILNEYPNIFDYKVVSYDMIESIDGFSSITAKQFVDNIDNFKDFMNLHPMIKLKITTQVEDKTGIFKDKKFVLTGPRDKDIIDFITNNGGIIGNSVRKDSYMLIAKDMDVTTSKASAAQLLGIQMTTTDKFKSAYNI